VTTSQLHLTFPDGVERERTVTLLHTSFPLHLNIRRANVDPEISWYIVELMGEDDEIERAVAWLLDQGVHVDRIPTDG
jgi:NIL domain